MRSRQVKEGGKQRPARQFAGRHQLWNRKSLDFGPARSRLSSQIDEGDGTIGRAQVNTNEEMVRHSVVMRHLSFATASHDLI
jgi:hypothetical protein